MKTKVTILGQAEAVKPELKKIEFVKLLNDLIEIVETDQYPSDATEVILINKDYGKGLDLMFAKYENEDNNALFLGHFNDGIV